jgi:hypothetical protein
MDGHGPAALAAHGRRVRSVHPSIQQMIDPKPGDEIFYAFYAVFMVGDFANTLLTRSY